MRGRGAKPLKERVDDPALRIFRQFDTNGDGLITIDELKYVFQAIDSERWTDDNVGRLLAEMDCDSSGSIEFLEFLAWLGLDDALRDTDDLEARQCLDLQSGKKRDSWSRQHTIKIDRAESIHNIYEVEDMPLDEGHDCHDQGEVYRAVEKATQVARAVKTVRIRRKMRQDVENEVDILSHTDHPGVIKLFRVFEDSLSYHLVMELCTGGELLEKILCDEISHRTVAHIMEQILCAVHYLHSCGICHRDLCPENFMILENTPVERCTLKIVDFGQARRFSPGRRLSGRCGSPFYSAPETYGNNYTEKVDIWSCGVIMYTLLCGYPPFAGETDSETVVLVRRGALALPEEDWREVDDLAKDLTIRLLTHSPEDRPSASDVVKHGWMGKIRESPSSVLMRHTHLANMQRFKGNGRLRQLAQHAIAAQLKDEEIIGLKELFAALDKNGDGTLTFFEFKAGIEKAFVTGIPESIQDLLESIDSNGNCRVNYTEFIAATLDRRHFEEEAVCWQAFHVFDTDGSGTICRKEIAAVLKHEGVEAKMGSSIVLKTLEEHDTDNDGQIDFNEFMSMLKGT